MKPKSYLFAIVLFCLLLLPGVSRPASEAKVLLNHAVNKTQEYKSEFTLTYIRVLINGRWWIYVYDKSSLIDVFPE